MKILYAIQGTGNGHLSRARDIIPLLQKKGDLDILVSGTQADISLDYPVKYKLNGLSFIFGKNGGIDFFQTFKRNYIRRVIKEIKELPVQNYDLVINDFEPISAWAAKLKNVTCVSLSHQSAVVSPLSPKPKSSDWIGQLILKYYAPAGEKYGFHFGKYDEYIYPPVIRREIREMQIHNEGHYTVYLPAYDDKQIIRILSKIKNVRWDVFSKHNKEAMRVENVTIRSVNNKQFIDSLASCTGILCGAGFETPAEALFMGKKLMVVPMKGQYEQHCNAAALEELGVPVIKSLKKKNLNQIARWVKKGKVVEVNFPDVTEIVIDSIIEKHKVAQPESAQYLWQNQIGLSPAKAI